MFPQLFEGCTASPWVFPLHLYRPGAVLYHAGDAAAGAFVILSGSVSVGMRAERTVQLRESFGDGDAVGLESLFAPVYARTARATQLTLAFFIPTVGLGRMIALEPRLALNVARIEHARLERVRTILPPLER